MSDNYEQGVTERLTKITMTLIASAALSLLGSLYLHERNYVTRAPVEIARIRAQADADSEVRRTEIALVDAKARADAAAAHDRAIIEEHAKLLAQAAAASSWNELRITELRERTSLHEMEAAKYAAQIADVNARERSRVEIYKLCISASNDPALCSGQKVDTVRCVGYAATQRDAKK